MTSHSLSASEETSISLPMLSFDKKLEGLEKKLDCFQSKLDRIEANQDVLKTQNETMLKLLAAVHVKIDIPKPKNNANLNHIPIMTDEKIKQEIDRLTKKKILTADDLNNFERTIRTKIDVTKALVKFITKNTY